MWSIRNLEQRTNAALVEEFGQSHGEEIYSDYIAARRVLVEDVLPHIPAVQPSISDHGPNHIADVLDNVDLLLHDVRVSAIDLYCLLMLVLFHDVGNLYDRANHNKRITAIYDFVRKSNAKYRQEKYIVIKAAQAHTGCASDGSKDTLKEVDEFSNLYKKQVSLRSIASILRLADELAEGPQRTSHFMQAFHRYDVSSNIFHEYANATDVGIDRGNGRVALTYNFYLEKTTTAKIRDVAKFKKQLRFTYSRLVKLDQERKYCKHYCDWLAPFKATTATFNFWVDGDLKDIGLSPLPLSDIIVPGEVSKTIPELNDTYSVANVCERLNEIVGGLANE